MEKKIRKILQKMIKIITKDSKVSKRNMIKSLNIVKKFMNYFVSFPLMIHLRYSCSERFIPSSKPFVQGA